MNGVDQLWLHPVLVGRDRWHEIQTPGGPAAALPPPAALAGVDPVIGDVPALGEHNRKILRELGYSTQRSRANCRGCHDGIVTSPTISASEESPVDARHQHVDEFVVVDRLGQIESRLRHSSDQRRRISAETTGSNGYRSGPRISILAAPISICT